MTPRSAGGHGIRLAVWSGPRNVSTALMRSWGNRPDTTVIDEPFYAYYLLATGAAHPGREEVIAHHETDWRKVIAHLTGPIPDGKRIFYQKHMSHHMLPEIDRTWFRDVFHAFLIRDPREVLLSLHKKTPNPRLRDTGFPQLAEIFEQVCELTGEVPPIIDARDLLLDPRGVLEQLCARLGVPFLDCMLSWPPGLRPTDGVWAKYWYDAVEKTTGFQPYRPRTEPLPEHLKPLLEQCTVYYQLLYPHRIRARQDSQTDEVQAVH